jgi:putative ABC transport system permease protein
MTDAMHDFRLALRQLLRQKGFLLTAVLTLGLGIGLVATQYSLIDGVLLRPLPFADGDRVWHVARAGAPGTDGWSAINVQEFLLQREGQGSFEKLAAFRSETYNLVTGSGAPQRLWGSAVTVEFFELLRVRPALGRVFVQGEDAPGAPLRALIGHAPWRDVFGGDPGVIGRSVRLNGRSAEIIGVMPEGFVFPSTDTVWVNFALPVPGAPLDSEAGVQGLGLLAAGVEPRAAAAELELGAQRFRAARGLPADDVEPMRVDRLQRAYNGGGTSTLLGTMLAMTVFVLLLACINVANLLFVRAADRARDLAVRSALGAGRGRIVRQLLAESAVIAAGGAVVGIAMAALGVALLQSQIAARIDLSGWMRFELDLRVLAVAVAASAGAGLLAGLLPAWRASRVDVAQVLRADGRGSVGGGFGRARRWLVAGQLAFACTALIVASLLAASASRSAAVTLAYDPDSLLIGRIELQGPAYGDVAARARFYAQLVDRVAAAPGVAAAAASSRDLVEAGVRVPVQVEGVAYARSQDMDDAWLEVASRDYFRVVDRDVLAGRLFDTRDRVDSEPVALVNRAFAERFLPGRDPIGARIRRGATDDAWATIVGVVPDLDMEGVGNAADGAGFYLLQDQLGWGWLDLLVRSERAGEAASLVAAVRAAVASLDPDQPVHAIRTLRERTERRIAGLSILAAMAMVFAGAALLLAAVGVFGVVAYGARARTREFGLRIALGASGGGIVALLMRHNATVVLAGIAAGIIGGFALSRPLAPVLPAVSTEDPGLYLLVAGVLLATTALACWLPARRAAGIDPQEALRGD